MSAWMWMPYFDRQVELGNITREEADAAINYIIEIDNMPELIITEEFLDKFNSTPTGGHSLNPEFKRRYLGKWNISEPIKDNF